MPRCVKAPELCKIFKLEPSSLFVLHMMFIYKITEVKICVLLREQHDITFAKNAAAAYMPC